MAHYLVRFPYQTPGGAHYGDEESQVVWIDADDEQSALNWCKEVAEQFVTTRYPKLPSWKRTFDYCWIERAPQVIEFATHHPVPSCVVGQYPEWPRLK